MAVIENIGGTANAEIDVSMKALRSSIRPVEVSSWLLIASRTGLLTGVPANAALFCLRNLAPTAMIIRRIGIGFTTTTAFTAAQELAFSAKIARAFTVSDTGGTPIALTGNNCKARTSLGTLASVDARIATTGALTAGTKTLDANDIGIVPCFSGGVGLTLPFAQNNLLSHDTGDYPIILAQNEGLNVMNLIAMGAAGVGTLTVALEVAEATNY